MCKSHHFDYMRFFTRALVLIILIGFEIQAQQKDKILSVVGVVRNAPTNDPIPYANIGMPNTEVGTLSNEDGSFSIQIY